MAGRLDVNAMLRERTAKEMLEWKRYHELEPFGAVRDNYHAAIIAKMIADVGRVTKIDGKRFSLKDLLLNFETTIATKEEMKDAPKAAATPWQHMKFIAKMMVASSKAKR